jgi:hypothetical protein
MSAASGEFHEGGVYPHRFHLLACALRVYLRITPIALEDPGLSVVPQTEIEDFPQPLFGPRRGYRRHHFHPPREIADIQSVEPR